MQNKKTDGISKISKLYFYNTKKTHSFSNRGLQKTEKTQELDIRQKTQDHREITTGGLNMMTYAASMGLSHCLCVRRAPQNSEGNNWPHKFLYFPFQNKKTLRNLWHHTVTYQCWGFSVNFKKWRFGLIFSSSNQPRSMKLTKVVRNRLSVSF